MFSFPYLESAYCPMSGSNCCFLTCIQISQKAGKMVWKSHLFKNFPQFVVIHISCFFDDPTDVGNLISGSSVFSKHLNLHICKFMLYLLLKPGLENFEHYCASMWNECNCAVVWTLFGTAFLWDWNENWAFLVLWSLVSFQNLLAYWMQQFHSIIF